MLSQAAVARRTLAVLVLLCAVVCAQAASLASEHLHQHSSQHCCGLCHTGPLPFIQASIASTAVPVVSVFWLELPAACGFVHDAPLMNGDSRAPPA
jgi:hypothetical protein